MLLGIWLLLLAIAAGAVVRAASPEFTLSWGDSAEIECFVGKAMMISNHRSVFDCGGSGGVGLTLLHEDGAWRLKGKDKDRGELLTVPSWAVSPVNLATSTPSTVGHVRVTRTPQPPSTINTFHVKFTSPSLPAASFYTKIGHNDEGGLAVYYGTTSHLFAWFSSVHVVSFSRQQPPPTHATPEFECDITATGSGACEFMREDAEADAHQNLVYARNQLRSTHEFQLTNGLILPLFGLGTGGLSSQQTAEAVKLAYQRANYHLVDTAAAYGNEREIGEFLSGLSAHDRPLTITKVWPTELGFARTTQSVLDSAQRLQQSTLDVVLLHWPRCYAEWNVDWMDCSGADADEDGMLWVESWRALEKLYAEGTVLAIGVSNFNAQLLSYAIEHMQVAPHVVQNAFTWGEFDVDVVSVCRQHGIYYQAYALIRNGVPEFNRHSGLLMTEEEEEEEEPLSDLAVLVHSVLKAKVGVLLRSSNAEHLLANGRIADLPLQVKLDVFDLFDDQQQQHQHQRQRTDL